MFSFQLYIQPIATPEEATTEYMDRVVDSLAPNSSREQIVAKLNELNVPIETALSYAANLPTPVTDAIANYRMPFGLRPSYLPGPHSQLPSISETLDMVWRPTRKGRVKQGTQQERIRKLSPLLRK